MQGVTRLISAMMVAAQAGQGALAPTAPASPVETTITRDRVELSEAGRVEIDYPALQAIRAPADLTRIGFTLKLWFSPEGGTPRRCVADATAPAALATAVCNTLKGTTRFTFGRGFAQPIDQGFVQLSIYRSVLSERPAGIGAEVIPGYRDVPLRYPPATPAENARIADDAGTLVSGMTSDVYPVAAMRAGLSGTSEVLLGISRDGRVATCRPLRSSGAALLDNATCTTIVRRGRFTFAPTALPYDGLRYKTVRIAWALPE